MTESNNNLFFNFKTTLNNYTAIAFGIGTYMAVYKSINDDKKKNQYKKDIRNNVNDEIDTFKDLNKYAKAITGDNGLYFHIIDTIDSLRNTSYRAGKAYSTGGKNEEYNRLQNIFMEDHNALIKLIEEELENA